MSEARKPNMMRGIAIYADPVQEMQHRHVAAAVLRRGRPEQREQLIAGLEREFGRETVRAAVGGEDA